MTDQITELQAAAERYRQHNAAIVDGHIHWPKSPYHNSDFHLAGDRKLLADAYLANATRLADLERLRGTVEAHRNHSAENLSEEQLKSWQEEEDRLSEAVDAALAKLTPNT